MPMPGEYRTPTSLETYDFIIVGAGSAGAATVARLR